MGYLAAYQIVGAIWGAEAKKYFLVGILCLYSAVCIANSVMLRKLRKGQPELAADFETDAAVPWYWRLLDVFAGVSFAFGPPLLVSLANGQRISWDTKFTGYHLIAMVGGAVFYLVIRPFLIRRYKTPSQ